MDKIHLRRQRIFLLL